MPIKPIGDRVLIKPLEGKDKTASGIVLPDSAKEEPQEGEVLAVGPGEKIQKTGLKKGDKVLYDRYGPEKIKINGKELLIAKEENILGIIE